MNTPIEIVFIGSSATGLEMLLKNNDFKVIDVLCLEKRLTPLLSNIAHKNNLQIKKFNAVHDFQCIINKYAITIPFFIYQLDMLVPENLTERYHFYNIHRGNLYTNRGPNPDIWPILNGDANTSISLHKINGKIDSGLLIDAYDVNIEINDDVNQLKIKMEKFLPKLICSLFKFFRGEKSGVILENGIYRPWIQESDITINPEQDSIENIERKIRSQVTYNGAILMVDNNKYYILKILKTENANNQKNNYFNITDDVLQMKCRQIIIHFLINKKPQYPSIPNRPLSKRI